MAACGFQVATIMVSLASHSRRSKTRRQTRTATAQAEMQLGHYWGHGLSEKAGEIFLPAADSHEFHIQWTSPWKSTELDIQWVI